MNATLTVCYLEHTCDLPGEYHLTLIHPERTCGS